MRNKSKNHISTLLKILMTKALRISLLFVVAFAVLSTSSAQDGKSKVRINLQFENATLKNILSSIEKQTDYIFIYSGDVINSNSRMSISLKDATIDKVLSVLFEKFDVITKIDGDRKSVV